MFVRSLFLAAITVGLAFAGSEVRAADKPDCTSCCKDDCASCCKDECGSCCGKEAATDSFWFGLLNRTAKPVFVRLEHEHFDHLAKCAKVSAECQVHCDACFKHCLVMTTEGKKEHAKSAAQCADCAECCKTCATLCARESALARHMLECCAKCCDDCAGDCEKFPDDKHMAACAKTCRECANECRETLKKHGN